jgi:hypothetical protein
MWHARRRGEMFTGFAWETRREETVGKIKA